MFVGTCSQELTIGGDQFHGTQAVDSQAVFADHPANPPTQEQATDTYRSHVARSESQAMGLERTGYFTPGEAWFYPRDAPFWVDSDGLHEREIDHQPAIVGAIPGHAMTSTAYGHLHCLLACKGDGRDDVSYVDGAHNQSGMTICRTIPDSSR